MYTYISYVRSISNHSIGRSARTSYRNVVVQSEASASSSMVTLNGEVTIPQQRPCHHVGLGRRLSSEKWALRIFSEYMLLGGIVTSILFHMHTYIISLYI